MPATIFLLIPIFKYLKKHTYQSENTWDNIFGHIAFQIFKKAFVAISERPGAFLLLMPFFKYLKNHTYQSKNS